MLLEDLQVDKLDHGGMGRFQDDGRSTVALQALHPAAQTEAPAVAFLQSGELELGTRGGEVVAHRLGVDEEFRRHDGADGVHSGIRAGGIAASIAEKSGHGAGGAGREIGSEDVVGHGRRMRSGAGGDEDRFR